MFFLFFIVIIMVLYLTIHTSRVVIDIEKLKIDTTSTGKIVNENRIYVYLLLYKKIKILKKDITKIKVEKYKIDFSVFKKINIKLDFKNILKNIDLKIDDFKPEYISKMDFYLEALDRQVRKENENPSVGIILCASKNNTVVEYSLSRSLSQTAVAEYSTKLIDKKLLENRVNELRSILEK